MNLREPLPQLAEALIDPAGRLVVVGHAFFILPGPRNGNLAGPRRAPPPARIAQAAVQPMGGPRGSGEAGGRPELGRLVRGLPGEVGVVAAEMAVRGGLGVDRP